MAKYNIEGNIDFYAELYKSLDIEEDDKIDIDKKLCLITNQPLIDNYVTLECGHNFNYIPIYKDIINHKQKFNGMEGGKGILGTHQIRCPYCRKKQDKLLPYYEELGLAKVNGVNFFDPKQANYAGNNIKKCMFKYPNENYDPTNPESESNSKYLTNMKCCHYGVQIHLYNTLNPSCPITYGDNNYYCYAHKKTMIKQYKAEQKQKEKDEAKASKLKAKDEAKEAKELEKQKLKEEKQKAKEEAKLAKINKNKSHENVVIGPSIVSTEITPTNGCIAVLKSGPNKGKHCGCKIIAQDLCGRHFKLTHDIINKIIKI
jgi:hypothetical protein